MERVAKFTDIPRICELMVELHESSKYSEYPINMRQFRDLCMESIRSGNNCLFVTEHEGVVEGFIMGVTDNLYHVLKVKYATDLCLHVSDRTQRGVTGLLKMFVEWARSIPSVVSIRLGATDAVSDFNKVAKLYERQGLVQEGVLYEMRIER